ncbi:MAG: hypothetical protein ACTSXO_07905 [Candidatus Heimdallarchaeota archaeon]
MVETEQEPTIKDLKEVFYDSLDDWPTETLKKALFRLRPEEGAEVYLNLKEDNYDLTDQTLEIEHRFRPKVTMRTRELQTELKRWKIGGGTFFRVIGDASSPAQAKTLSLQYFILWTRQLFPFQFIFLSVPFFIATLFLWQFSELYPVGPADSLTKYLMLLVAGTLFICLGIWTVFEGMIKRNIVGIKNWKTVPDSMVGFVVPGILFWTTGLEYAILEIAGKTDFFALIPISAWLSLLLGIIILFIGADFYLRGEKSFVERFSHPMDYAPLLIFLVKNDAGEWVLDGAQFDYFHYKTMFVPKEKLAFMPDDERKEHPWFLIDRSWHAFRVYIKPSPIIRFFSNIYINVSLWIIVIAAYTLYILARFNIAILDLTALSPGYQLLSQIGAFIVIPMFIVLMVWSRNRTWEEKMALWEELEEKSAEELLKMHHLTFDRLRILWNLRNREHKGEQQITNLWSKSTWIEGDSSRLVARVKLQYPFDRYKDWHTLRDTQEELLSLISLQTKREELRELQEDIIEVQDALKQQVVRGIQTIEDELTEFYLEQQEEIEEEKEEIIEKLEKIEESALSQPEGEPPVEPEPEVKEETLEIPEVPTLEEVKGEEKEEEKKEDLEEEFKIPDIPIDVEKEDD